MCTAVTYKTTDHYFGRNLDLEYSYKETITITPRNYVFPFRKMGEMESHFAISVWHISRKGIRYTTTQPTRKVLVLPA
mgnify:CR=1 FL=1